jgi:hypothetical protein
VPDETVYIHFITEPPLHWSEPQGQFIRGIKFNGGQGKTGIPWLYTLLGDGLAGAIAGVVLGPLYYFLYWSREAYYDCLREAIQLGLSAAREELSEEQLKARSEARYGRMIRVNGKALMKAAEVAFTEARPSPT